MPLPGPVITSRRQSLGLALLSMAGLHQAATTEAKNRKKNRKKNEKCDRKVERAVADRCGQQIDFCLANLPQICEPAADAAACDAIVRQCCEFLRQCDLASYVACAQANFPSPASP